MPSAAVIVIGGGVNGASTLFHLAQAGVKDILLLEQGHLAAGATGKSGALVRMHYTNPAETQLAVQSLKIFQHWGELVGGECGFTPTGFVHVVGPAYEGELRATVAMQRSLGVESEIISAAELHQLEPACRVDDLSYVAYEPGSGYADPLLTCYGFVRRAQELGARVQTHTTVTAIRTAHGRVVGVDTTAGPIDAPVVLLAGGAWANQLLLPLEIDLGLAPNRLQVVIFRWPLAFAQGHRTFIDTINHTWFRPDHGNGTLIGAEWIATNDSPDNYRETADPQAVAGARSRLVARFPAMAEAPMRGGWAGMVMMSPDGRPIIDQIAAYEGLFVMAGDSGTSFKTSPAIGKALAEWIRSGQPRSADLHPFRATRFHEDNPWGEVATYGRVQRTVSR
jgi:sarcosine oxidase, subunit beta